MSHIFISYSRKDIDVARKIVEALAKNELETWIDWKSIPKGEDWEQEIYHGIEAADAFLFLISPDSAKSEMCNKEIAHAIKNNKRVLPIVSHDTDIKTFLNESAKKEISKRNWVFCRIGQDDFDKAIEDIQITIHTDYAWLKYHTALQVKAINLEKSKNTSWLIRGKELQEAEEILTKGVTQDPQPIELQRRFVLESRREEIKTRNSYLAIAIIIALTLFVLSVFAITQRNSATVKENSRATAQAYAENQGGTAVANEQARATAQTNAEEQANIAISRQLATLANSVFDLNPTNQTIAGLLAVQSIKEWRLSTATKQSHLPLQTWHRA